MCVVVMSRRPASALPLLPGTTADIGRPYVVSKDAWDALNARLAKLETSSNRGAQRLETTFTDIGEMREKMKQFDMHVEHVANMNLRQKKLLRDVSGIERTLEELKERLDALEGKRVV